jgi:hypothetical protein
MPASAWVLPCKASAAKVLSRFPIRFPAWGSTDRLAVFRPTSRQLARGMSSIGSGVIGRRRDGGQPRSLAWRHCPMGLTPLPSRTAAGIGKRKVDMGSER